MFIERNKTIVISLNTVLLLIINRKIHSIYVRPIKTVSNKNILEHTFIDISIPLKSSYTS